ncbi:MAG: substrate-binding domain-containing protein, partial [Gemmataceae bacterium]
MKRANIFLSALAVAGLAGALVAINGCGDSTPQRTVDVSTVQGATRLNGGGATFPEPIITRWKEDYKTAKGIEIDYQAKGSGAGIQQMTQKTIEFGCSDAPMKKSQLEEANKIGGDVIHVPLIMGAIVPVYNIPDGGQLTFTGELLADIYLGKIKKWNDP